MKKLSVLALAFSILLTTSLTTTVCANPPEVEAIGAILIDCNTGRILWGKNESSPLAMASTTKIMTAIYAIENGNLNDVVTVSKRAAAAPDVQMKLLPGEKISLNDLLYALMLQSYNDAAIAIAEHLEGTVEEFCMKMTERAKELGATDTVFETPNGLDVGNHHSTALDMAVITRHALSNSKFREIIKTPNLTVKTDKNTYDLQNKDRLLTEYEGALGVKTGFTGKAGHCFVGAAERNGMLLVSVVLGSGWGEKGKSQKWVDTKRLLNYGFDNFKYKTIIKKDDIAGKVTIERSKTNSIDVYYEEGLILPITKEEESNISIDTKIPIVKRAPVSSDEVIGVADIYINGEKIRDVRLLATSGAVRHDLKTSLEKVINEWFEMGTYGDVEILLPEF